MSGRYDILVNKTEKPVGRDSKTHGHTAPAHGREFDRKSQAGEKRFPSKQGAGRGNWGNAKDDIREFERKPREPSQRQKEREEERQKLMEEDRQKHAEYLSKIKRLDDDAIEVVAPVPVHVEVQSTCPKDLVGLGNVQEQAQHKRKQKVKNMVSFE